MLLVKWVSFLLRPWRRNAHCSDAMLGIMLTLFLQRPIIVFRLDDVNQYYALGWGHTQADFTFYSISCQFPSQTNKS